MKHPFEKQTAAAVRKIYWLFFGLTALSGAITGNLANFHPDSATDPKEMRTVPTVQFEFAKTPEKWNELAANVGCAGTDALRRQTYMDYVFLVCYSTLIAAGVIGVTRGAQNTLLVFTARWLAWGQWLAGLLDGIENYGLLVNLAGPVSGTWTLISFVAAKIKFAFVIAGALYIIFFTARSWRDPSE